MAQTNTQKQLSSHLADIKREELVIYGVTETVVKEINLGSGEQFVIHYSVGDSEILEAYFVSCGERIQLDEDEVEVLSQRF